MSLQARHNLVLHQVLHLEGYTRQRDDNCAALRLKPHTRRCAVGVEQYRAAVGHHSLTSVKVVERDATTLEQRAHVLAYALILVHRRVENACQRMFGYIVLGGA